MLLPNPKYILITLTSLILVFGRKIACSQQNPSKEGSIHTLDSVMILGAFSSSSSKMTLIVYSFIQQITNFPAYLVWYLMDPILVFNRLFKGILAHILIKRYFAAWPFLQVASSTLPRSGYLRSWPRSSQIPKPKFPFRADPIRDWCRLAQTE